MSIKMTPDEIEDTLHHIVNVHRFGIPGHKVIKVLGLYGVPRATASYHIAHAVSHGTIILNGNLWLEIPEKAQT